MTILSDSVSSYRREATLGWIMIVSTNSVVQMLGATVLRMSRARFATVRKVEDAVMRLKAQDSTIIWEQKAQV
jgi:hypothetical protein